MIVINRQRHFRITKLEKYIKDLDLSKDTTTRNNFDQFTELINNKDTMSTAKQILNTSTQITQYGEPTPITNRVFLTAFLIYGFKEYILNDEESELNDYIYKLSTDLVIHYESLQEKLTISKLELFYKLLKSYNENFKSWKEKDLQKLVHNLTLGYYDLDMTINMVNRHDTITDEDREYIVLCRENQDNLKQKIKNLGGEKYFNNYKPIEITLDQKFQDHLRDMMLQAYWDILSQELKSEPPVYNQLIKILGEIRDLFCQFVPSRIDIQTEIRDKIDPELIKNMLVNNAFDDENLYNLAKYIISLIKMFQPPAMDSEVTAWEQQMMHQFEGPFEYSEFLVIFFKSVFNMINTILICLDQVNQTLNQD